MDSLDGLFQIIIDSVKTNEQKERALAGIAELVNRIAENEDAHEQLKSVTKPLFENLDTLPNAIWIRRADGSFFYHNKSAQNLMKILEIAPQNFDECEIPHEGESYLLNCRAHKGLALISATNITKEKRKERLAAMGQVAAQLAHEIRNPICAIGLMLSALEKSTPPQNAIHIDEMKKALWRVERLIEATLLFSKGVSAKRQIFPSDILQKAAQSALFYYTDEISKPIDFVYEIRSSEIFCDGELLELLVQNLILNAIEAVLEDEHLERGRIVVEFYKNGAAQCLKIHDNAQKIANPTQLFEAFHTTKIKGHGLGLALCKQIAEAHNGEIGFYQSGGENGECAGGGAKGEKTRGEKYFCVRF